MLKNRLFWKVMPASLAFLMALILMTAIAVTSGFVHIQMDQVIAPPGIRVLDWLWKVFICHCAF
jgi:hypothetical protein